MAPQWLIDQMERLKQRPPPTAEQMRKQWKASMNFTQERTPRKGGKGANYKDSCCTGSYVR